MSVEAREGFARSWLSADFAKVAGAKLAADLIERCKGEDGVFLSLTYRRDDWEGPLDLYRAASEERHVRLFIRSLGNILGESLSGRWLCKMEFQQGGWLHFHIVLLGVKYVPHDRLTEAWGMGHVWVNRISNNKLRYLGKYVAKGGQMPPFLYAEKLRSVKVIRVSPGFWRRPLKLRPQPVEPAQKVDAYKTVGDSLEQAKEKVVLRDGNVFKSIRCVVGLSILVLAGFRAVRPTRPGWVAVAAPARLEQVAAAVEAACAPGGASEASVALHLIQSQVPHSRLHRGWVAEWFRWRCESAEV